MRRPAGAHLTVLPWPNLEIGRTMMGIKFSTISRAIGAAATLVLSACSDVGTAPVPVAIVSIAPPPATVYAFDAVPLQATYRDPMGNTVPAARFSWSVSDSTRAEISSNGLVTALRPGIVRVTARSGAVAGSYDLVIAPLVVQRLIVSPATLALDKGDIVPIGIKVEGPGERVVPGRAVTLTSDNPSVALIDPSGRVRGVSPGVTTVRATADGVTGTMQVIVGANDALLVLSRSDNLRLPLLVDTGTVMWDGVQEFHEIYLEAGSFLLSGGTSPRYEIDMRFAEYKVFTVNGQRGMQLRLVTREYDRGLVAYDTRGDLRMTSDYISPLAHTASPLSDGFHVRFRIPGTDEVRELLYRREPR